MKKNKFIELHQDAGASFDFFRLSNSKVEVDLSPNTIRSYHKQGLPLHRRGRNVFVSLRELEDFIRNQPMESTAEEFRAKSGKPTAAPEACRKEKPLPPESQESTDRK